MPYIIMNKKRKYYAPNNMTSNPNRAIIYHSKEDAHDELYGESGLQIVEVEIVVKAKDIICTNKKRYKFEE